MLAGFLVYVLGGAIPVDVIGKLVLNIIAIILLIRLGRRMHSGTRGGHADRSSYPRAD
jgi:hypothetical protein